MADRPAAFVQGPRFFQDGEATMFECVIDAGNVIGPRLAHKNDIDKHPEAWKAFNAAEDAAMKAEADEVAKDLGLDDGDDKPKSDEDDDPPKSHHKPAPKAGKGWKK